MYDILLHKNLSEIDLKMIVAMDAGGGIGKDGKLPWPPHKKDFARFKELTMGAQVIMGRKTFEEIESLRTERDPNATELLPGRESFVVSSKNISTKMKITVVKSLLDAIKYYNDELKSIYVLGGLQMYTEALPYVKTLYLTQFDQYYECDRHLPLGYLSKHFNIVEGTREEGVTFLKCNRVIL